MLNQIILKIITEEMLYGHLLSLLLVVIVIIIEKPSSSMVLLLLTILTVVDIEGLVVVEE